MQYSIVNYQMLDDISFRFDSEFYHPEHLKNQEIIKKCQCGYTSLGKIINYISGGATPLGANYPPKGIPFLRVQNVMQNYFDGDDIVYIADKDYKILKRSSLKLNDVLLTITGVSYGKSAVVIKKYDGANINQHCVKIEIDAKRFKPYFVSTFLNSTFGKKQSDKFIVGVTRPALDYERIKQYLIPCFSYQYQQIIENVVIKSQEIIEGADALYQEAEQILLSKLGLLNWKPKHQLSFVKNFSDTQASNRIDAEYYQPKYEDVQLQIKRYKYGYKTLGEIIQLKEKNFQPEDDVVYRYIELANISSNGEINGFIEAPGKELPTRARRKVRSGGVVVSTIEGSLSSIALITDELDNALCSTGFFVINSRHLNSESLLVLLKSQIGQLQLKKGCSGTILSAIGDDEFKRIVLPNLPANIQAKIKKKITDMYNAKVLSKRLLEIAKRGVEIAIEKSEKEAQNWIDSEFKKVNGGSGK